MLIFDQLKKNDPQLRTLAVVLLGGLFLLLVGLWWVQVVSAKDYQANLETQSFRTVRIPAVRGRILDRNGTVLAENRPTYNIGMYLEELRRPFEQAYSNEVALARKQLKQELAAEEARLRRKVSKEERKRFVLTGKHRDWLRQVAHFKVASNVMNQVSHRLGQPLSLNATNFERHYRTRLALPYPVLTNVTPVQIALFEEQSGSRTGVDVEIQSTRYYPYNSAAAHVLGHLQRDDSSMEGEESFFSFRLPDYRGSVGIEYGFDKQLRGMAGAKSVLVNNAGYRQVENVWSPAEAGENVVLTIDLGIQQAAERELQVFGPNTRGAVVVMDVQTGDILAMASSPTLNPNSFLPSLSRADSLRLSELHAEKNRATQENYQPGSIFKPVVGLACLEAGLDPSDKIYNPGYINVGRKPIHDLAPPGYYDFRRAIKDSSNTYFITNGLRVAGISNIVKLAQRLHLGESTGLPTRQEVRGIFPSLKRVHSQWYDGDTANICIGQGPLAVTPIQMAVMTAAIANGGKVLWPRLVDRLEPADPARGGSAVSFPSSRVRDELGVRPNSLHTLREAMLGDVEDSDGTGRAAAVPGMRIGGKTGTAQVMNERGQLLGHTTWFISFAPYEAPRYAVVVMVEVEMRGSGGLICAPVAGKIYKAILERQRTGAGKAETLARAS
jgi:penicillin-binding protein 2